MAQTVTDLNMFFNYMGVHIDHLLGSVPPAEDQSAGGAIHWNSFVVCFREWTPLLIDPCALNERATSSLFENEHIHRTVKILSTYVNNASRHHLLSCLVCLFGKIYCTHPNSPRQGAHPCNTRGPHGHDHRRGHRSCRVRRGSS